MSSGYFPGYIVIKVGRDLSRQGICAGTQLAELRLSSSSSSFYLTPHRISSHAVNLLRIESSYCRPSYHFDWNYPSQWYGDHGLWQESSQINGACLTLCSKFPAQSVRRGRRLEVKQAMHLSSPYADHITDCGRLHERCARWFNVFAYKNTQCPFHLSSVFGYFSVHCFIMAVSATTRGFVTFHHLHCSSTDLRTHLPSRKSSIR